MNLSVAIPDCELPVRFHFAEAVTDAALQEFCRLNEGVRVERDADGGLLVMAPAGMESGGAETDVATELVTWAREDGRGRGFGSNTGFKLKDGSIRLADAMWVSWERIHALRPEERRGFAPVCPEFVIEVRSASDRLQPLREKMSMWLAQGAELGWLIDPERRVVEVYRPGEQEEVHEDPTSVQGTGPVRGFALVMSRVWGS